MQNRETKLKMAMGCLLIFVIGIITGAVAVFNGIDFDVWSAMFIVTVIVAGGLIYTMSN